MPRELSRNHADFGLIEEAQLANRSAQLVYRVLHGRRQLRHQIKEIRRAREMLPSSLIMKTIPTNELENVIGGAGGAILGGMGQAMSGAGGLLGGIGGLLGGIGQLKVAKAQAAAIKAKTASGEGDGQQQQQA